MRKKEWRVYAKKADFNQLAAALHISPLTVRIMRNRDLQTEQQMRGYLTQDVSGLYSPWSMKDMKKAVEILQEKICQKKKIWIVGDYDIDGVCSIAVLYRGLTRAGADVEWRIPHRILDGYGVNPNMIRDAAEHGADTLLTCDNGISAREAVSCAKSLGMTVIITDHHDIPESGVPEADAVVNPKQEDCSYPFQGLCGAVVAWKLVTALFERMGIDQNYATEMLEFAAMATVGDVMDLRDENRLIVKLGLERLHHTEIPGLLALIDACELQPQNITAYHIGFVLGPTLNAGGRLETAQQSAELLLCTDPEEAAEKAQKLRELNTKRKSMTEENVEAGIYLVETTDLKQDRVLVVYLAECHESLAGIVAGRLRERYYRPCIVLTKAADGGAKGSGRSIEGYHMFQELQKVSSLLSKFGGHPMAAGLSLPMENVEAFRKALNENCILTENELTERIWIDIPLPVSRISMDWIRELDCLEPFGKGNEKPVFADRGLKIRRAVILGKNRNVLKLFLEDSQAHQIEGMIFNQVDEFMEDFLRSYGTLAKNQLFCGFEPDQNPTNLSIIYYPQINEYRQMCSIQIVIKDWHLICENV